ncbi:hypothetical protein I309_03551 [Cryptococcus deuterogattii LA55]|nr:hypothetical protein I309_03551 [Cryptococcus deuterogattii LA55]KIR91540.1 hypothetical protein I304_04362 [Cryptococcus deuterogattii CBS 10090]
MHDSSYMVAAQLSESYDEDPVTIHNIKINDLTPEILNLLQKHFGSGILMFKSAKRHGFINFERLDSAVAAYEAFNDKKIFGAYRGPIQVDFARVPTRAPSDMTFDTATGMSLGDAFNLVGGASTVPMDKQLSEGSGGLENYRSPLLLNLLQQRMHEKVLEKDLAVNGAVTEQQMIMQVFDSREDDHKLRAEKELHPLTMEIFDIINLKTTVVELSQSHLSMGQVDDICRSYVGHYVQFQLAGRYDLISKRFLPHLSHLCNHIIASCSILRIIAQSSEPGASKIILKRMFLSKKYDCVLKGLLSDSPTALQFIGKVLGFSTISPGDRLEIEEAIRTTLATMSMNYTPEHHALVDFIGRTNSRLAVTDIQARRILPRPPSFKKEHPLQPAKLSLRQTGSPFVPSFQLISSEIKGSGHSYHPSLPCRRQSFGQGRVVISQAHTPKELWYSMPLQAFPTPEFLPVQIIRPTTVIPPRRSGPKMCLFQLRLPKRLRRR